MSGPLLLAVESSCDETGVALVEGGRRIHANVVASQIALHAPTGGIVPEVAARAHLRWIVPALDEALGTAGRRRSPDVDARRGHLRPGARRLAAGRASTSPRRSPGRTTSRSSRSTTSRATSTRAGCSIPGEAEREAPPFPLVALVVSAATRSSSRCATTSTYRLLGQTVDDAAGEAFDKVGRLLGLGYPGGPAISRAAEGATGEGSRRSRGRGWATRTTSASRGSRRPPAGSSTAGAGRRGPAGRRARRHACPSRSSPSSRGGSRTRSSTCSRRRRSGRPRRSARAAIVLGGGVAANAALRARIAGEAEARGHPAGRPAARACAPTTGR